MRWGVSPAAAPNPMGAFNQRFEALFRCAGALGYVVCFAPRRLSGLSMRECGAAGSATRRSACPVLCHSEFGPLGLSVPECRSAGSASVQTACPVSPTLRQSRSCDRHVSPLHPGACLHPSYRSGCMFLFLSTFFIYLDFLAIRFSVSSGCARRRSVSTYAAILVLQG